MSDVPVSHPAVDRYLRDLDVALARMPADRSRELREQITERLGEALGSDPSADRVTQVLASLGDPAGLVAEAAGSSEGLVAEAAGSSEGLVAEAAGSPAGGSAGEPSVLVLAWHRFWRWARALSWPVKIAIAVGGVLAVLAAANAVVALLTPILVNSGGETWWYPQDAKHAVQGQTQTTVRIRSNQLQGIAITLYNPSPWTQTVVGLDLGDWPASLANPQVGVSPVNAATSAFPPARTSYAVPMSIPAHQSRVLRLLWTSRSCIAKGAEEGFGSLALRVRVGLVTKTETVQLTQEWFLAGPSKGTCY